MRCSLFFFVSLIVFSYAAPVPMQGTNGISLVLGNKAGGATPLGGGAYGAPRLKRDDLLSASEVPPPETVPKKLRDGSRLSDSKHRPKQLAAALKAAETKRDYSSGISEMNPVAGPTQPKIDLIGDKIKKVLTGRDSVLQRDGDDPTSVPPVGGSSEGGDLTPRDGPQGRDNAPTSSGVTSFTDPSWIERLLNGNSGSPTNSRDVPDVDLAARDGTADTHQPSVHVDGAVPVVSHPVAVHKRDGDEPSVA